MKLDAIINEIKETGNYSINYPPSRTIQVTHYFELKEQISLSKMDYFPTFFESKNDAN